jgi:uncharacterized membrane protein
MAERHDDAPLVASKQRDATDEASAALIEARGDSLTGSTVTIRRPRAEVYAAWRDFSRLAQFMENVERIDVVDDRRSHWVVKAPGGRSVEWDARITEEEDGALIAWASEDGADVPNSGRVTFRDAQGDRGTLVSAMLVYDPPAGAVGRLVAKLFQREPAIQARRELRRFKQLMEAGEVATAARTRAALVEEKD